MEKKIPDIQLLGDYILVKKIGRKEDLEKRADKLNIVIPDIGIKERSAKGIVLKVSENCKFVKPRQKIIFFMYAPIEVDIDDDKFLIMSEQDVLAIMEEIEYEPIVHN